MSTRKEAWQKVLRLFQARLDQKTRNVWERNVTTNGLCYTIYRLGLAVDDRRIMLKDVESVKPVRPSNGLYYWPTWARSSTVKERNRGLRSRVRAIKKILRNIRKEERN